MTNAKGADMLIIDKEQTRHTSLLQLGSNAQWKQCLPSPL